MRKVPMRPRRTAYTTHLTEHPHPPPNMDILNHKSGIWMYVLSTLNHGPYSHGSELDISQTVIGALVKVTRKRIEIWMYLICDS